MKKVLVTGGGGFLGLAIVKMLLAKGCEVTSLSRTRHKVLDDLSVRCIEADLSDGEAVVSACAGMDTVFHVAAKAGVWGSYGDYYNANVTGTRNILVGCRANGVSKLVYTSSPSVVFGGTPVEGLTEADLDYLESYECHYAATKAIAEKEVLAANCESLRTVSLRPHLIWGPNDNNLVPRIIARGRAGRLRIVGKGDNKVDTVYVDNAAAAHILAWEKLSVGAPIGGKAYFISQGEPMILWDVVNAILGASDVPPVTKKVPASVAWLAGAFLEAVYTLFRLSGEPPMTRFVAHELALPHWFNITAAREDLGYEPQISFAEGIKRLRESLLQEQ